MKRKCPCVVKTKEGKIVIYETHVVYIAVADPGFSLGGGANSQKCYYFSIFCRKLHENERIWNPQGGRVSLAPPLDPPMHLIYVMKESVVQILPRPEKCSFLSSKRNQRGGSRIPRRRRHWTSGGGGYNIWFCQIFPKKYCMNLRKFWAMGWGGGGGSHYICQWTN